MIHVFKFLCYNFTGCNLCIRASYLRLLFSYLTCVMICLFILLICLIWIFIRFDKFMLLNLFFRFYVYVVVYDFTFWLFNAVVFIVVPNFLLLDLLDLMVCSNRFFYLRLYGLSLFSFWDICFNSLSDVLERSCGLLWNVRLFSCYELFSLVYFLRY